MSWRLPALRSPRLLLQALWISALLAVVLTSERAVADEPAGAALFIEGRFAEAGVAAGADLTSADAQAMAARAYAAAAMLAETGAAGSAWAAEARRHAEAALAIDPENVEGRLQLAVSLWLESRRQGGFEAYRNGLPQQGRALIESALANAPDDAWARAMMGAWHFEALRRGGRLAARLLQADLDQGRTAFAEAMSLDPADAAIPAHLGLAYLSLGVDRHAEEARAALSRALSISPRDAFEAAMQDRAREALTLLERGDEATLEERLRRWIGGG